MEVSNIPLRPVIGTLVNPLSIFRQSWQIESPVLEFVIPLSKKSGRPSLSKSPHAMEPKYAPARPGIGTLVKPLPVLRHSCEIAPLETPLLVPEIRKSNRPSPSKSAQAAELSPRPAKPGIETFVNVLPVFRQT